MASFYTLSQLHSALGMTPALCSKYPGGAHELVVEKTVVYRLADADYSHRWGEQRPIG